MKIIFVDLLELGILFVLAVLNFGWVFYPPLGTLASIANGLASLLCFAVALWQGFRRHGR